MLNLSSVAENKNKILTFLLVAVLLLAGLVFYLSSKTQPSTREPITPASKVAESVPLPPRLTEIPATPSGQPSAQRPTGESEIAKIREQLPYATPHFEVKYVQEPKLLEVTFFPILNRSTPEALEKYANDLKEFKKEFLDWLKTNGVDPEKVAIVYSPDPDNPFTSE